MHQHKPKGAIFEFASPIPRNDGAVLCLLHESDGVENTRHGGGSQQGTPDDGVRRSDVVQQFRGSSEAEMNTSFRPVHFI